MRRLPWALLLAALAGAAGYLALREDEPFFFVDATEQAGLGAAHNNGFTGEYYMPETFGGGCAFLDYDSDGDLDVFFVQSGQVPGGGSLEGHGLGNRLFRNDGTGAFEDVTGQAGVHEAGYGMGCAVGDLDGDGDPDLYITCYGPNRLYRNDGDGTFTDVTEEAGVGDPRWGTSAAVLDYDGDGRLDLFVVNYVDFYFALYKERFGARAFKVYPHPDFFDGVEDVLYRNLGGGAFADVTAEAGLSGLRGKGLGVVTVDHDRDGDTDLFVANDSTPNFLLENLGGGRFAEVAATLGVGHNGAGSTEACMGVDAGDVDGDGWQDLFVTNLDLETNTLYRSEGGVVFSDVTRQAGLATPSYNLVGFATAFVDIDNDLDLDLFVVNGHILDNIAELYSNREYAQADQVYENTGGGVFAETPAARAGRYFSEKRVGRGAAFGDVDEDGDVDAYIVNNNQRAVFLKNEAGSRRSWVQVRLIAAAGPDAIGALVTLHAGGRALVREVRTAYSYLAASDPRLTVGLDRHERLDRIEVRWPSGRMESFEDLRARRCYRIEEGGLR